VTTTLAVYGALATVAVGLLTFWGAYLAYRANRQKAAADREQSAGSQALEYVKIMRGELDIMRRDLTETKDKQDRADRAMVHAVRYIDALVKWGAKKIRPPMPTPPPELHEFLDPAIWQQVRVANGENGYRDDTYGDGGGYGGTLG
jgi:hypothetical protein